MSKRRSVIALGIIAVLLIGANYVLTARQINSNLAARQKAAAAARIAVAAAAAQTALCESVNIARADQVGLWTFILHLNAPPRTTRERLVLAEFEHQLHVTFAPRVCPLFAGVPPPRESP